MPLLLIHGHIFGFFHIAFIAFRCYYFAITFSFSSGLCHFVIIADTITFVMPFRHYVFAVRYLEMPPFSAASLLSLLICLFHFFTGHFDTFWYFHFRCFHWFYFIIRHIVFVDTPYIIISFILAIHYIIDFAIYCHYIITILPIFAAISFWSQFRPPLSFSFSLPRHFDDFAFFIFRYCHCHYYFHWLWWHYWFSLLHTLLPRLFAVAVHYFHY